MPKFLSKIFAQICSHFQYFLLVGLTGETGYVPDNRNIYSFADLRIV